MSNEKVGEPDYPPPYVHQPDPGLGNTNYGFAQTSGTAGGYPMSAPPTNPNPGYSNPGTYAQNYSNVVVTQVGPQTGPVYSVPPPDYTMQAILACLFCFWPTALVAIFRANEAKDCAARGDMIGAHSAANSARQLIKISIIVGILSFVALGVFLGVYIGVVLNNIDYYNY